MKTILTIGTETGLLFGGNQPGSLVFVPESCVIYTSIGKASVDKLKYVQSGWDVKNMRFNSGETNGNRLFPDPNALVSDLTKPAAASFVARLQRSLQKRKSAVVG